MSDNQGDVSINLIRALVQNMNGAADDWQQVSMVVYFDNKRFGGTYGYAYSPDGTISAVASRPFGIKDAIQAYMDSYYGPDDAYPVKLLMQLDRAMGEYEILFEEKDMDRWKVTPATIDTVREELRPRFTNKDEDNA